MKQFFITTLLLLGFISASAATPQKQTHLYAVKGADSLYLDHYISSVDGKRPCMMFVFGGGFVGGQRDNDLYSTYFNFLTDNGYDVVSIDYRLGLKKLSSTPDISMKDVITLLNNAINMAVEDLFSATLYVLDNAEEWQIDTNQIVTSGSSAGAITVLQAENALCNLTPSAAVLPADFRYAGVVSCAGAIFTAHGKPKFDAVPAPMLLFHGTSDSNVPYNKASVMGVGFYGSKYIAKQLEKMNAPYWFYAVEYADHKIAGLPLWYQCELILQFINDYVIEGSRMQIVSEVEYLPRERHQTHFTAKEYLQNNYKRRQ